MAVPILAAGLAAALIAWQIRKSGQERLEDRRGAGVRLAHQLLEHTTSSSMHPVESPVLARLQGNRVLVDMYTYLVGKDLPVARWVAMENNRIRTIADTWFKSAAGVTDLDIVGPERAEMARIAAEASQKLLEWMRGDVPVSWFVSELEVAAHTERV